MSTQTLFSPIDIDMPTPSVVASYGLGVDSTAIVLRWLEEPASRDFPLNELVLCTSMAGNEFFETGQAVTDHVLPRLRRAGVRFVQVARSQRKTTIAGNGVVVLDDTTTPQRLHLAGVYTLGDEMLAAGTLPQLGGLRACSLHSKASCLEPVVARITRGQPYRHVLGYEFGEQGRALRDRQYDTPTRSGWYPLVDWQWTRQICHDYVADVTGHSWQKSACGFCVFSFTTEQGRRAMMQRYRRGIEERLKEQAGRRGDRPDGITRHILRERATDGVDHLYVAAPAGVEAKQRPGFENWWQEATGSALF